ncbi:MAG: radical SAM protein [Synergistaceae bacterium]|nr:radical SAM protein [Synergistaceae bacterium]
MSLFKNLEHNFDYITLILKLNGNMCNMRCAYCNSHEELKDLNNINLNNIFNYLAGFKDYKNILVLFHGGEPLLSKPEDIEAILDFACKNLINKINVQFQTNGLLLDDKWLNLFKRFRNIISLSVSFDPPVGDMRRYVTSQTGNYREIVMNNIYKFMGIIENIGVISVCHKYNINGFKNFVCSLKEAGIKNLTINKYRPDIKNINNFYISEAEYVDMLIDLASFWIGQKLYKKINIQPLNSLFAGETNKLCLFKTDKDKCFAFRTYFNAAKHYKFCARMADAKVYEMSKECLDCKIFSLCGGGCPVEKKDGTFCEARFKLFNFINFIRSVGDADKKFES